MQNVSKRTILWIVPLLIIFILWYMTKPDEGKEYISYIKSATLENGSVNLENALNGQCDEEEWVYFRTNNRQNVVEFKGACPVNGEKKANVNLQFIVEKDLSDFTVGAMLLDGEQQSPELRDQFLKELLSKTEIAAP
ncbi:glucosamine 6-phosphate synthetase [Ureibacillus thermophilus]|uniref:Glucosamine 6-phosphate synthetase n=1 Tax=Ureibacillus thermophilus TaxID=367743 RepID=A0A4P6UT99_9BACL|nr:glucosamine 6-phosphate synthetase [Ureibacillus thermophilus]QBK25947.1 glucosamine 6-phosphate synthetase [Ureibacillus thermophilus]